MVVDDEMDGVVDCINVVLLESDKKHRYHKLYSYNHYQNYMYSDLL
jgi:hypothetical protein